MPVEVLVAGKPLHYLPGKIAVGHGMADRHRLFPRFGKDLDDFPARLGLSAAGADGADRNDRLVRREHGVEGADDDKIGAGRSDDRGLVHHFRVGHIAVGKGHQVHTMLLDHVKQPVVCMNRDAFRVKTAGQLCRIPAPFDIRDLGGGKTDHAIPLVVPEIDVEIVKIPAGGPHDDDVFHQFHQPPASLAV